jgi:hypothetical protein
VLSSGRKFDVSGISMRLRYGLPFFSQTIEMERDGLTHVLFDILAGASRGYAAGQIRRERGEPRLRLLYYDQVFLHCFSPACFITLLSVPGAKSSPGFPGTVTNPSFVESLYCR